MITLNQAIEYIQDIDYLTNTEKVNFLDSLNRVLAKDIRSDINMPPFDKSAMDGYACRMSDISDELEVIEIIKAGQTPQKTVNASQCSKIMTGAQIPEGTDCVLMVEHTEELKNGKIKFLKEKTKSNICYLGEDIKESEVVLTKGTKIKAQHVAVMASVGCIMPEVFQLPEVAVISTGDELVEPKEKPGISKIRNSNAYQLLGQLREIGIEGNYYGIALDNEESTREIITNALSDNEIILLTGGVSMGDFDYVPAVLNDLGIKIQFDRLAVQPGKPTTFAVGNNKFVFGLPGNPVSSFVQFNLFVKPFINRIMGGNIEEKKISIPVSMDYKRKRSERLAFVPARINSEKKVEPIDYHGSAHINALNIADCLFCVPIGVSQIKKGELVDVRFI